MHYTARLNVNIVVLSFLIKYSELENLAMNMQRRGVGPSKKNGLHNGRGFGIELEHNHSSN